MDQRYSMISIICSGELLYSCNMNKPTFNDLKKQVITLVMCHIHSDEDKRKPPVPKHFPPLYLLFALVPASIFLLFCSTMPPY